MHKGRAIRSIDRAIKAQLATKQKAAEAAGGTYSITDAARDIGITRQGLSRWMDGALPNRVWLLKLSRWLDMPVESLRALHDLEREKRNRSRSRKASSRA